MPNRFNPYTGSDMRGAINQFNRNFSMLDKEVQSKKYRVGDSVLAIGSLNDDGVGIKITRDDITRLFIGIDKDGRIKLTQYDETGKARILIGDAPDGDFGGWFSKEGFDVEDLFS